MSYQLVRKLLDIMIFVLLVIVMIPTQWYSRTPQPPVVTKQHEVVATPATVPNQIKKSPTHTVSKPPEKKRIEPVVDSSDYQVYLQVGVFKRPESVKSLKEKLKSLAIPQRVVSKNGVMYFYIGPLISSQVATLTPILNKMGLKPVTKTSSKVVSQ